jgi:hypothetical protein
MVEQGDIVKLNVRSYNSYVVTKHDGKYLLISLKSLNRREEFVHSFSYEPTNINVKDLNIEGLVDSYIEANELDTIDIDIYKPGMILKNNYNSKNYGCVIVNTNEHGSDPIWQYYIIDLSTFTLHPVNDFEQIQSDYKKYNNFNFHNLKIVLR